MKISEVTYTTWTIQGIYDTAVASADNNSMAIRNDGKVYWNTWANKTTYIISPAGGLLATLADEYPLNVTNLHRHSIYDRYILFLDAGFDEIVVQEDEGETWRRAVALDKGVYALETMPFSPWISVSMSPSGEWIAVVLKEAVTGNGLIFIYKGS